jgi:hypothetical protein
MRVNTYATVAGFYLNSAYISFDYDKGRAQTQDSPEESPELVVYSLSWRVGGRNLAPALTKDEREELEERLLQDTLNGEYSD